MKSLLIISATVLLLIQPLQTARAADSSAATTAATSGSADSAKAKKEAPKTDKWEGTLEKLDSATSTFVVGGKEFMAGKRAVKILVDGLEKTWASLKVGDKVNVVYFPRKEGACIAKNISKGVLPSTVASK